MMRRAWTGSLSVLAVAASVLVPTALIVRATVRDAVHGWDLLFYATPWPVLAGLSALLAGYWRWRGARAVALLLAVASVATLGLWCRQGWRWRNPIDDPAALRVVLWNVDRPDWRLPGVLRWLKEQNADLIAIAEREPLYEDTSARWRAAFPDYQWVPSEGQMLCLVRGEVLAKKEDLLDDGSFGTLLQTRIRGHALTVLQVDLKASPFADRGTPLRRLAEIISEHRQENLLVAGDFNTPLESAFFPALRTNVTNAFEAVGRGCAATWPRPVPVLSLDQIWTSSGLRPLRCELVSSWRSDHRAVVAEFDFTP